MKHLFLSFVLLLSALSLTAQVDTVEIYKCGDGGYAYFRIPAIMRSSNGTLFAFAEGRWKSLDDAFDIDLVVRRSFDGGKTWGPIEIVWDDADNTCGNPTPVQDPVTGRIYLFMNWNLGPDEQDLIEKGASIDTRRIFMTYSDDDGETWADPSDLTASLKDTVNWTWHGVGPCHGLVKTRAPFRGRLIIPAYCKTVDDQGLAYTIYSDDYGRTWQRGNVCSAASGCGYGASEASVAECSDGSLYLSMRTTGKRDSLRHYARSIDGGLTWTEHYIDSLLYDPRCQGSVVNGAFGKSLNTLLYLHPQHKTGRRNLTLSVSRNDGISWNNRKYIYPYTGYSDLVVVDKNKAAILYEADQCTRILFQIVQF